MKIERAIKSLKEKQAIILRTDNDHWLYEPISTVLEELEVYKKALYNAVKYEIDNRFTDKSPIEYEVNNYLNIAHKELMKAREENEHNQN